MTMDTSVWRFLSCCLAGDRSSDLFCAAELISAADAGANNSAFSVFHQERWYRYDTTPDWSAIAMAAVKYPGESRWLVLAVSSRGFIWELYPRGPVESVSRMPFEVELTNAATIGQVIYVCGMGRTCYVRSAAGVWKDVSAPWPRPEEGVIGFTDLAGLDEDLMFAVGWSGEIWVRSDGNWEQEDSPTNANFNAIAVGPEGDVYCVADGGVMVKGRRGAWETVETGIDANLQDVCVHGGDVFACTDSVVLRLVDGGLIDDFAPGGDVPRTCLRLRSDGHGALYSVGPYDVFKRLDEGWERLA